MKRFKTIQRKSGDNGFLKSTMRFLLDSSGCCSAHYVAPFLCPFKTNYVSVTWYGVTMVFDVITWHTTRVQKWKTMMANEILLVSTAEKKIELNGMALLKRKKNNNKNQMHKWADTMGCFLCHNSIFNGKLMRYWLFCFVLHLWSIFFC